MIEETEEPKSLEEFFLKYRDAGKKDEEIVKMAFEADINASVAEIERITALPNLTIGRIKGQVSMKRKREAKTSEKEKEKALEEGEIDLADARQLVAQFGREGLNKIKRGMLVKVLKIAPGMTPKTAEWILHKWDISPRVQDDPNDLYNMLHTEVGLRPNIATSITRDIFSIESEYADILQQRGEAPVFISAPFGQPQQPSFIGPGYGYQPQGYSQPGPFQVQRGTPQQQLYPGQPQFMTREDYYEAQRREDDKRRVDKVEARVDKLDKEFGSALDGLETRISEKIDKAGTKETPQEIVEEVPVGVDGKPCPIEKAVTVVRRVIRPAGLVGQQESFLDQLKKAQDLGIISKPGGEAKKAEETTETREIRTKLEATVSQLARINENFEKYKETMDEKEKERVQNDIAGLRTQISTLHSDLATRGVTTTEGMLAALGNKALDRQPLPTLISGVEKLIYGPTGSPPELAPPAGKEARAGVLSELGKHGLVTMVQKGQ